MKKPNLLLFGIDSLRTDHMSMHGYPKLTTPHIENYLKDEGIIFNNCISPSVPTTPGYSSMLSGMDCFSTNVVALRHKGTLPEDLTTLPELLKLQGYNTTCIGFTGNAASRGFDTYLNFEGWVAKEGERLHKAENLNKVALPELERLANEEEPFFLFLRHMEPHSPYLPPEPYHKMFFQSDEFDKNNDSMKPVFDFKPFSDYFEAWIPEGCTDKDYVIAQYDAEIAYMDTCIQIILERLDTLGLADDTVVIFTSDHGETLYDHDCWFAHHIKNCRHQVLKLACIIDAYSGCFAGIFYCKRND